jgi:hypothetical protein
VSSQSGLVLFLTAAGLAAGFTVAMRLSPPVPETRAGGIIFWTSRLLAGAALAVLALELYAAVELQRLSNDLLDESARAAGLAGRLARAVYEPGLLLLLAAAIAALGPRVAGEAGRADP